MRTFFPCKTDDQDRQEGAAHQQESSNPCSSGTERNVFARLTSLAQAQPRSASHSPTNQAGKPPAPMLIMTSPHHAPQEGLLSQHGLTAPSVAACLAARPERQGPRPRAAVPALTAAPPPPALPPRRPLWGASRGLCSCMLRRGPPRPAGSPLEPCAADAWRGLHLFILGSGKLMRCVSSLTDLCRRAPSVLHALCAKAENPCKPP